jgi:integrase
MVASVLRPCWGRPVADGVRSFIERVLDYAMVKELRPEGLNPARLRGNVDTLLRAPKHVTRHHEAIPHADVPALVTRLASTEGDAGRAMRLLILAAARLNEIRLLRWREVHDDRIVIDAARYKTRTAHTIPLTDAMRATLGDRGAPDELVFRGVRGGPISEHVLGALLPDGVVPHGFRSTFAVWAVEHGFASDDVDRCLGHLVGSPVTRTYIRSDFFEPKRALLDAWTTFATSAPSPRLTS